jgi:hypothetical protein
LSPKIPELIQDFYFPSPNPDPYPVPYHSLIRLLSEEIFYIY